MQTQLELARAGVITAQVQTVAHDEKMDAQTVRARVAAGQIVIPSNPFGQARKAVGIGRGLRTKVNASIGTSSDICDIDMEVRKAVAAEEEWTCFARISPGKKSPAQGEPHEPD